MPRHPNLARICLPLALLAVAPGVGTRPCAAPAPAAVEATDHCPGAGEAVETETQGGPTLDASGPGPIDCCAALGGGVCWSACQMTGQTSAPLELPLPPVEGLGAPAASGDLSAFIARVDHIPRG
jgi:hypothetical protein